MYDAKAPQWASPRLELHWMGWTAHSDVLARHGWKFGYTDDHYNMSVQITFESHDRAVRGITQPIDQHLLMDAKDVYRNLPLKCNVRLAKDMMFEVMTVMPSFVSYDANASVDYASTRGQRWSLSTLFQPTPDAGILVPADTVDDLMARILDLQEPAKQERIKERVRAEQMKVQSVPAKILKFG